MIIGIGTDIVEISRVENLTNKNKFIERFFNISEQEFIKNKQAESAAGYFCAKEAVVKALGTGFSGMKWTDVEIIKNNSVPGAVLHNRAKEIADSMGVKTIFLSISHCREYAVATAVLEG
jgi:phosphopantetheine--protein transferase-like protein